MAKPQQKIKRVQPVIRVKQAKVEAEAANLNLIRSEKIAVVAEMRENQRKYIDGIDQLNAQRASLNRELLAPLEDGLDYIKAKWFKLHRQVQDLEHQEKVQLSKLLAAQRDLKAIEKLEENYKDQFATEIRKNEQKAIDETAIRRYNNQS
jgi:flagellar export protein FliJ